MITITDKPSRCINGIDCFNLELETDGYLASPAVSGQLAFSLPSINCSTGDTMAISINGVCGPTSSSNKLSASDFVTFKQNAIGEATVVINYGYARYGTTPSGIRQDRVSQAAAYAAAFVQELNINQGANIKYWEIGNETYGNWEAGYDVNGSIDGFQNLFEEM